MNFAQLRQHQEYTELWKRTMGDPQVVEGLRAIKEIILSPPVESYDISVNALQNKFTQGALAVFELISELAIYNDGANPTPLPTPYEHIAERKRREVEESSAVYAAWLEEKKAKDKATTT